MSAVNPARPVINFLPYQRAWIIPFDFETNAVRVVRTPPPRG